MNHSSNLKSLLQRLVYFFLLQILIPSSLTSAEDNIATFIQSCISISLASLQVKILSQCLAVFINLSQWWCTLGVSLWQCCCSMPFSCLIVETSWARLRVLLGVYSSTCPADIEKCEQSAVQLDFVFSFCRCIEGEKGFFQGIDDFNCNHFAGCIYFSSLKWLQPIYVCARQF